MTKENVNEKPMTGSPLADAWSIRPCSTYKDEYDDCTSIKGRFHQYFIHGEMIDCKDWLQDYKNCKRYQDSNGNDIEAGEAIVRSEEERRTERFKGHFGNTVWQKRKAPPDDWSKPLPEWMTKRNENSYLHLRQMELEGKAIPNNSTQEETKYCIIM